MALLLVFDTECNSLDTENGYIQEIAWAKYQVGFLKGDMRLVSCESFLLNWKDDYVLDPMAEAMTGISKNLAAVHGEDPYFALTNFLLEYKKADFVCGQNVIGYDIPMISSNLKRLSPNYMPSLSEARIIDTYFDLPISAIKPKSLKYYALDHGYILQGAHQAMNDVFACAHMVSCYSLGQIEEISATPLLVLNCEVAYGDKKKKDLLYSEGFRWNPDHKHYEKTVREFYRKSIEERLGFELRCYPKKEQQLKLI